VAQAYPIVLDLTGRAAVIIGGGEVAARKAQGLLNAGAAVVRCVAPEFCDLIPPAVKKVNATYCQGHLDGAFLVFAATDQPDVNDAVVRDARAANLLVNRADSDDELAGDFVVPASHATRALLITVSAGSPALSRMIRDRLAQSVRPQWDAMAELMRTIRPAIRRANLDIAKRRVIFRDLATDQALDILERTGEDGLRRWLLERHPELTHA